MTWFVPVLLGFATVILVSVLYSRTHPIISARILYEAKMLSVDPIQYNELQTLDILLFKHTLTAEQWQRYKGYALGSDLVFKRQTAKHLCGTRGYRYEQEALTLTKTLVTDADPSTRANALFSLSKFADPSWKENAQQLLADPSPAPRKMAALLLDRERKKLDKERKKL